MRPRGALYRASICLLSSGSTIGLIVRFLSEFVAMFFRLRSGPASFRSKKDLPMLTRFFTFVFLVTVISAPDRAEALSDCPVDAECGVSPMATFAALPLNGLSILSGTFIVPALLKSTSDEGPSYARLMFANLFMSTVVGLTVLGDPAGLFDGGDEDLYLAANGLFPLVASVGTSLLIRAMSGSGSAAAIDEALAYVPALGVRLGEDRQGLVLGWNF